MGCKQSSEKEIDPVIKIRTLESLRESSDKAQNQGKNICCSGKKQSKQVQPDVDPDSEMVSAYLASQKNQELKKNKAEKDQTHRKKKKGKGLHPDKPSDTPQSNRSNQSHRRQKEGIVQPQMGGSTLISNDNRQKQITTYRGGKDYSTLDFTSTCQQKNIIIEQTSSKNSFVQTPKQKLKTLPLVGKVDDGTATNFYLSLQNAEFQMAKHHLSSKAINFSQTQLMSSDFGRAAAMLKQPSTPQNRQQSHQLEVNSFRNNDGISVNSDLFSQSQSNFKNIRLKKIDLNKIIKNYDSAKPKLFQIDIRRFYRKTGLPMIPKSQDPKNEPDQLTKEIFMVHNFLRVYKQSTIQLLEDYQQFYKGSQVVIESQLPLQTQEGCYALINAIDFIKKLPPLKPLYYNKLLSKISHKHAVYCSERNQNTHIGSDGTKPLDRLKKYGQVYNGGAENISLSKSNAFEIIISLIIDDGVANRTHRQAIFNQSYRTLGISSIDHKINGRFTVMDYAFYFESSKKVNKVQKIIEEWDIEDKQGLVLEGNDHHEYVTAFEYPYLVKKNRIVRGDNGKVEEFQDVKDIEKLIYDD